MRLLPASALGSTWWDFRTTSFSTLGVTRSIEPSFLSSSESSALPIDEVGQLAPIFLRRPALLFIDEGGRRHLQLLGQSFALGFALRGFFVQRLCDGGGASMIREVADDQNVLIGREAKTNLVAELERLRRFRSVAVDLDLSAVDCLGRERQKLEEAGRLQPFVESK